MDVRAPGPSFVHWVHHWADRDPGRTFVQDVAGGELSYGQARERGELWAAAVQAVGIEAGGHAAMMVPTSLTFVEAFLGLAVTRVVPVPINTDFKGRLLVHVLENSQAELLIIASRFLPRLEEVAAELNFLRRVVVIQESDAPPLDALASPARENVTTFLERGRELAEALRDELPRVSDVAGIIYTSGTTGASKGVMVPWGQLESSVATMFPHGTPAPEDVYYVPLPLFHLSGWYGVLCMAMCGGRVVLRERFKTAAFWDDVEKYGCTTVMILGAMKEWLVASVASWPAQTTLRNALIIPLGPSASLFSDRLGIRVSTMFGMTETGHPIVSGSWNPGDLSVCGRVRAGYQCQVVDDDDNEVPDGTPGELLVRSDHPWRLNLGYFAMPEQTLAAWRNLWFHTGDFLIRHSDGSFSFVDRKKDAIRRRGENISSAEVEAEVMAHPAVLECAAFPVASEFGEDEVMVALVRKPGVELSAAALIAFLEPRMPRFMIPRYLLLTAELPKTETEKIRKHLLREQGVTPETWDREGSRAGVPRVDGTTRVASND